LLFLLSFFSTTSFLIIVKVIISFTSIIALHSLSFVKREKVIQQ